ncbi:hypothetical protein ACLBXX_20305, partial [Microbacterium sp. C23T]
LRARHPPPPPPGPATDRVLDVRLTEAGRRLRAQALEVPGKVMASVGTDAAALLALRDALQPFAGAR